MKLYDFKRLIDKYSVTFCLHYTQGEYVSGRWEQGGKKSISMRGAIVPIKDSKIYSSGGTYSAHDRELYITSPISEPLSNVEVVYKNNIYKIENGRNFEDYADVAIYDLKWVGVSKNDELQS